MSWLNRRCFSFTLRTLFVIVTATCVWLGWNVNLVRQRKIARASVHEAGGGLCGWAEGQGSPKLPWIRRALGDTSVLVMWTSSTSRDEYSRLQRLFPEATINPTLPTPR